jgi:two-component system sensor histidine kinase/response regulator
MRGDDQICLDAGMNGYISKPIDRRKLTEVLAQYSGLEPPRPPAAPIVQAGPAVDFSVLDMLKDDLEADTVVAILVKFMEDASARAIEATAALGRQDFERIRREAHTIKGAAASLGLSAIRDACLATEAAARAGQGLEAALPVLTETVNALPAQLNGSLYALPEG